MTLEELTLAMENWRNNRTKKRGYRKDTLEFVRALFRVARGLSPLELQLFSCTAKQEYTQVNNLIILITY